MTLIEMKMLLPKFRIRSGGVAWGGNARGESEELLHVIRGQGGMRREYAHRSAE